MKKRYFSIGLVIFLIGLSAGRSFADIQHMETKRERMLHEAKESPGRSSKDAYLKIHENFLRENYSEVDRLAASYLAGGLSEPNAEDVLYLQALSLLKLNRGDEARSKLRELEGSFTSTDRKASTSASIADSYFYEGNNAAARQAYQETLAKYPNSDQTSYISSRLKELSSKLGAYVPPSVLPPVQSWKRTLPGETSYFTVQVGAFSKVRNANALMKKMIRRHYDAYVDRDAQTGIFRVRVGRLPNKTEASALEERLKGEGYPTQIYP